MTERNFPIASIIFEGDYRLGMLQALSIDRLYDEPEFAEYTIVLNGSDNIALRHQLSREFKRSISPDLRKKIVFLEWQDLLGNAEKVGYYDQQSLKLALSLHYDSKFYLMLDAKNHFVRPSSSSDFFSAGLPFAPIQKTSAMWRPYVENSLSAMENSTTNAEQMMPSITPYLLYTKEVRAVIDHITNKYDCDLPSAMSKSGGTEFLLYYAQIAERRESLYIDKPLPVSTLFTVWPQEHETVMQHINDVHELNLPIFGLHRNRLPQLNDQQTEAIVEMWNRHLLNPWENAHWFLNH